MRIGIDFGTCLTSAALFHGGTLTLVKDSRKLGYSFPSSVYITENNEALVGHAAEYQRLKAPSRHRREFKRDLGQCEPYLLGDRSLMPEDLVAEVLRKVRAEAAAMLNDECSLTEAVIGVPAAYSGFKRGLMMDAARKAGFETVDLIEEPVAAALYYGYAERRGAGRGLSDGDILLVYDLGGGTFDAALLQKRGETYSSLALPAGLEHCGGVDFDRLIFDDLRRRCSAQLREMLDTRRDLDALRIRVSLAEICREVKHQLSEAEDAEAALPTTPGETYRLTREEFTSMISPLIGQTCAVCRRLVQEAGVGWEQIAGVLTVGGCARIPAVHEIVARELGRPVFRVDDPELAICQGAALAGAAPAPSATPPVFVVAPEPPPGGFATLGRAVRSAPAGARIEVHEGLYEDEVVIDKPLTVVGTGDRAATVLTGIEGPALTLWGGGIEIRNLTLRGKAPQTKDNSADSGVRVREGSPLLEDCDAASLNGTAVAAEGADTAPTLRRCALHDSVGGAAFTQGARGLLEDCTIEGNRRAGVLIRDGADPLLRRCTVRGTRPAEGDEGSAGVVADAQGRGTLEDCDISGNAGFGVLVSGGDPLLRRCRLHDNLPGASPESEFGFASTRQGRGTLEECEIYGNRIGIAVSRSAPALRGCRILGRHGPAVNIFEQSQGVLEDCTVMAQEEAAIVIRDASDPTIRRCAIHGAPGFPAILAHEQARGTVEECRFPEANGWDWCVFNGCQVRGLIGEELYAGLRQALERRNWAAADQASIAVIRRAAGVPSLASMELAQRIPDEILRTMDKLWTEAGGGPLRDRPWIANAQMGVTGMAGWFTVETCLQRRLRESGVWSSVPPAMFESVRQALAEKNWHQADQHSRALVLHAAGCECISDSVRASSISPDTLRTLSALWKEAGRPLDKRVWVTNPTVGVTSVAGVFSGETWLQRRLRECCG